MTIDSTTRTTTDHQVLTALHLDRGQLCDLTNMFPDECGCNEHYQDRPTVISVAALERLAGHSLPAYRVQRRDPRWKVVAPQPTICEHRRDGLCVHCEILLNQLLTDLPDLVDQLGIAMRKDVRFAPHGFRRGDKETPDEAPIPWSPAAARTLNELRRIMNDDTLRDHAHRHQLLTRLSTAASKAHRIIERPKDTAFVGPCPQCGIDLWVERDHTVTCQACNYHATWLAHQQATIDARGDQLMTMDDVVKTLNGVGEPITRKRVEYLEKRYGLPREKHTVPHWQGQTITTSEVWMYRLKDVRELQAKLAGPVEGSTP